MSGTSEQQSVVSSRLVSPKYRLRLVFLALIPSPFLPVSLLLCVCSENDHHMSSGYIVAIAFGILLLIVKDETASHRKTPSVLAVSDHQIKAGLACSERSLRTVANVCAPKEDKPWWVPFNSSLRSEG